MNKESKYHYEYEHKSERQPAQAMTPVKIKLLQKHLLLNT